MNAALRAANEPPLGSSPSAGSGSQLWRSGEAARKRLKARRNSANDLRKSVAERPRRSSGAQRRVTPEDKRVIEKRLRALIAKLETNLSSGELVGNERGKVADKLRDARSLLRSLDEVL